MLDMVRYKEYNSQWIDKQTKQERGEEMRNSLKDYDGNHMLQEVPEEKRNYHCNLGCNNGIYLADMEDIHEFREEYSDAIFLRTAKEFRKNRKRYNNHYLAAIHCPDCIK